MKANLKLEDKMRFAGTNADGLTTYFDTHSEVGGEDSAATPMEIMLQAMAACSAMDVVSILRKKRKTIDNFEIEIDGERRDVHPKMFVKAHLKYKLKSPDAEIKDLERAIELSQSTYCGASAMFKAAGCDVSYSMEIEN